MDAVSQDWNERHKQLSAIIRKQEHFADAISMISGLHAELHTAKVYGLEAENKIDELFHDLSPTEYAVMPTEKDETIAWAIWHIARIEDLTMNLLAANREQVFNKAWQERMNSPVTDTGNAMSDDEIIFLSRQINTEALLQYKDAVGTRSREIVAHLTPADMKRKVSPDATKRILSEGGVTEQADSIWLLDFWARKDVAGLILMPLTRHQTAHLNDCFRWKKRIRAKG